MKFTNMEKQSKQKRGQPQDPCRLVEQAYLRRATGYDVTEVKREYRLSETGDRELTRETEQTKHIPGDPRAAEFWLTNRAPERWRKPGTGSRGEPEGGEERGVIVMPEVGEPPEELGIGDEELGRTGGGEDG